LKIKPKKIFNTIMFVLFTLYISFYVASVSGYYEYEKSEQNKMTEEKMKEFENDIKNGKKVDIKDYLTDNKVKYDNKVTEIGNTLSDLINNGITGSLEKTFKVVEKLIE
jgi:hypothetical protein